MLAVYISTPMYKELPLFYQRIFLEKQELLQSVVKILHLQSHRVEYIVNHSLNKNSIKKRATRASALRADGLSYTMGLVLNQPICSTP